MSNALPGRIYIRDNGRSVVFKGDLKLMRGKDEFEEVVHGDGTVAYKATPVSEGLEFKGAQLNATDYDPAQLWDGLRSITAEFDTGETWVLSGAKALGRLEVDVSAGSEFTVRFSGQKLERSSR